MLKCFLKWMRWRQVWLLCFGLCGLFHIVSGAFFNSNVVLGTLAYLFFWIGVANILALKGVFDNDMNRRDLGHELILSSCSSNGHSVRVYRNREMNLLYKVVDDRIEDDWIMKCPRNWSDGGEKRKWELASMGISYNDTDVPRIEVTFIDRHTCTPFTKTF